MYGSATTGGRIRHANELRRFRNIGVGRRRHDAIDHRAGKRRVRGNPLGERGIERLRDSA
jgi:hypothetical protein